MHLMGNRATCKLCGTPQREEAYRQPAPVPKEPKDPPIRWVGIKRGFGHAWKCVKEFENWFELGGVLFFVALAIATVFIVSYAFRADSVSDQKDICVDHLLINSSTVDGDAVAVKCSTDITRVQRRLRVYLVEPLSHEDAERLLKIRDDLHGRGL